jgi:hypothetical protein
LSFRQICLLYRVPLQTGGYLRPFKLRGQQTSDQYAKLNDGFGLIQ